MAIVLICPAIGIALAPALPSVANTGVAFRTYPLPLGFIIIRLIPVPAALFAMLNANSVCNVLIPNASTAHVVKQAESTLQIIGVRS